jgi:hypothetical protein
MALATAVAMFSTWPPSSASENLCPGPRAGETWMTGVNRRPNRTRRRCRSALFQFTDSSRQPAPLQRRRHDLLDHAVAEMALQLARPHGIGQPPARQHAAVPADHRRVPSPPGGRTPPARPPAAPRLPPRPSRRHETAGRQPAPRPFPSASPRPGTRMSGLHQRHQADKKAQGLLDGRGIDTQRLPGAPLAGKRLRLIPQPKQKPRSQPHANRCSLSTWCWASRRRSSTRIWERPRPGGLPDSVRVALGRTLLRQARSQGRQRGNGRRRAC